MRKVLLYFLTVLAVGCVVVGPVRAQEAARNATPPYRNPSLRVKARVDALVSGMTLEEKVLQMQNSAPAIPRLGVPAYNWWNEADHGVGAAGYATVFPQAIGMAATWDVHLIHSEGEVIATEARAKYNQMQRENNHSIYYGLTLWSPNINIVRDPRWGRGQETYGEDPYLSARLGVAYVRGVQGDDTKYFKAIATPKHFAVHSGPEPLREGFDVNASPHDLEDTYLPAFRATITEGHAGSIMCAYNAVDGAPACANTYLLEKTLREAWGFRGYVTSDCAAVGFMTTRHHYTPDDEHGSAVAVRAGTDITCGDEYVTLVKAVHDGLIRESDIDTSVKRLFTARMRLGMFDPPNEAPYNKILPSEIDSAAHRELALKAARESMVLLKNNGALPLKPDVRTIAVIGPEAESVRALEGDWNYYGTPRHPVLPLEGLRKKFAGKSEVLYAQGTQIVSQMPVPVPRSVFQTAGAGVVSGLKAEYFSNVDFAGRPVLTRIDPQIQFDWNAASPEAGIPMRAFAVRWSGTLTPPGRGAYTFSIGGPQCYPCQDHETFRVYLDDKLLLENTVSGDHLYSDFLSSHQVSFADTNPHGFRVEYTHRSSLFGAGVTLDWQPPADVLREEAVKVAKKADVVVAFVGLSPDLEGEEMPIHVSGFEEGDRTDIGLPPVQKDLLEALVATGKPLVVVLLNGSALAVNWAQKNAAAILEAWYPGEEGGTAIAETLAGENNPGGRLPITFYASLDQLPSFTDYSMQNRTYRYFQGKPLYGFGYGLSYSTFDYSNLKLSSPHIKPGQDLTVEVEVRNTSQIAGNEVTQLYLEFPQTPGAPRRALRGFLRVRLPPGDARPLTFKLDPRDLSQVMESGERTIMPGSYTVFVGGSQPGEGAHGVEAKLQISGEKNLRR